MSGATLRDKLLKAVEETKDPLKLPERVLEVFARHVGADFGGLYFQDPSLGVLRLIATYGWEELPPEIVRKLLLLPSSAGLSGQAFREKRLRFVRDYPGWAGAVPEVVAVGVKSVLSIPLRYGQTVEGVLSVTFREPRDFPETLLKELEETARLAASFVGLAVTFRLYREHGHILQALFEGIARLSQEKGASERIPGLCALTALFELPDVAAMILARRYGRNLVMLPETLRVKDSKVRRELRKSMQAFSHRAEIRRPNQTALAEAVFRGEPVFLEPLRPGFRWRHPSGERVFSALLNRFNRPFSLVILPIRVLGEVDRLVIFAESAPLVSEEKRSLYRRFAETLGLSLTARIQDQVLSLQRDIQNMAFQRKPFEEILQEALTRVAEFLDLGGAWALSRKPGRLKPLKLFSGKGPRLTKAVIANLPRDEETFTCEVEMYRRRWTLAGMRYPVGEEEMVLLAGRPLPGAFLRWEVDLLKEIAEVLRFAHQDLFQWHALEETKAHLEERVQERTAQLNALLAFTERLHRMEDVWEVPREALRLLSKGLQSPFLACGLKIGDTARFYLYRKVTPEVRELSRIQAFCQERLGIRVFDGMEVVGGEGAGSVSWKRELRLHAVGVFPIEEGRLCLVLGTFTRKPPAGEKGFVRSAGNIMAEVLGHLLARRREELKRLTGVLESLKEGVVLLDRQGRVLLANRSAQEILQRAVGDGSPGKKVLEHLGSFKVLPHLESLKEPVRTEVVLSKRRQPLILQVTLVPYAYDDHEVAAVMTLDDVTEIRLQQAHLARAQRMAALGELAAGVAHEINNPLAIALGFAEAIRDHETVDGGVREMARKIVESTRRAADVVKRLLSLSQIHQMVGKEALNLNDVVLQTVQSLREAYARHGITIHLELDPHIPLVYGNWGQISQMLIALLNNARDAMIESGKGDRIVIRTVRDKEGVRLEVEDNGPGIPEEYQERIFDPFFTTKAPGKGMGLGLTMVQQTLQEHGGRVWVTSVPGEGAVFSLWLPAAGAAPREEAGKGPAKSPPPPSRKPRVLLVGSDEGFLSEVAALIRRRGKQVVVWTNPGQGQTPDRAPDLVLWDLDETGVEEMARIRRFLEGMKGRASQVVLVGKRVPPPDLLRFLRRFGLHFILKPTSPEELAEEIEGILSGGNRHD